MIKLKNLSTGYSKDNIILDNYSYEFSDDKIYCIMGRSGIGKTTLLKTISGLIKPISGEVIVGGTAVNGTCKEVYMMNQVYTSFDWLNCVENITIIDKIKKIKPSNENIDSVIRLLDLVGLSGYGNFYPSRLSGGQRQRLAFARAMYARPKYLLMDEPLSALDSATRKSMQSVLVSFQRATKSTIIVVTHSEDEAEKIGGEIVQIKRKTT